MNTTVKLTERFKKIRAYTKEIFKALETGDYVVQAAPHASPPKWNLGHQRFTYRNFFHPWERWQYTGIRLAK